MECYFGHLHGVLVFLEHHQEVTWVFVLRHFALDFVADEDTWRKTYIVSSSNIGGKNLECTIFKLS